MKVKSESEVAQSCPTLSDPMDCSLTGSSAHGIFQARVLEWGAIAFSIKAYTYVYLKGRSVECSINYSTENDGMLPKLFYEITSPWQKNSLQCRRKI